MTAIPTRMIKIFSTTITIAKIRIIPDVMPYIINSAIHTNFK